MQDVTIQMETLGSVVEEGPDRVTSPLRGG